MPSVCRGAAGRATPFPQPSTPPKEKRGRVLAPLVCTIRVRFLLGVGKWENVCWGKTIDCVLACPCMAKGYMRVCGRGSRANGRALAKNACVCDAC